MWLIYDVCLLYILKNLISLYFLRFFLYCTMNENKNMYKLPIKISLNKHLSAKASFMLRFYLFCHIIIFFFLLVMFGDLCQTTADNYVNTCDDLYFMDKSGCGLMYVHLKIYFSNFSRFFILVFFVVFSVFFMCFCILFLTNCSKKIINLTLNLRIILIPNLIIKRAHLALIVH